MTFRLIEAERAQHTVSRLCSVLGVTRAGFYAWSGRRPSARERRDRQLMDLIERIHEDSRETYGVPRIHAELVDEHGIRIARKRVAKLMRRLGIEGVSRRGKRPVTTTPKSPGPAVDDLVRRQFRAPAPNRLWVADITYVPTREGFLFLAYEVIESTPKSHNARVIDLDEGTVELLRAHRERQQAERDEWGSDYEDHNLLVARENGAPIHPHSFSQMFERTARRCGVRSIRLHDLRHTHATLALKAGVPVKVVSVRLGHESPAFTLKQYAHVIPGMQAAAAAVVADLIRNEAVPDRDAA
jgi:hypothetical protein